MAEVYFLDSQLGVDRKLFLEVWIGLQLQNSDLVLVFLSIEGLGSSMFVTWKQKCSIYQYFENNIKNKNHDLWTVLKPSKAVKYPGGILYFLLYWYLVLNLTWTLFEPLLPCIGDGCFNPQCQSCIERSTLALPPEHGYLVEQMMLYVEWYELLKKKGCISLTVMRPYETEFQCEEYKL